MLISVASDLTTPSPAELPVLEDGQARRRADAKRNYERVLWAAARLFAEQGPENTSMEAIAAAAGVGKGTLFRAFTDRAGLAGAVLSENEARFQDQVIRGPAPLGPGAPPIDRLGAFGTAYMQFLEANLGLVRAAEFGTGGRFKTGPFAFYRVHVGVLVREALAADVDHDYLADVLLAPLSAEFFGHQRTARGRSVAELADAYCALVERVLTCR
jgi:AcrR family transcriptional regulator